MEVAEPIGVIFSLTPDYQPHFDRSVQVHHGDQDAERGDFQPAPQGWRCCSEAVRIMYETAVKHGAPEGVFTCLESHTLQDNAYLMHHKDVGLIDATGGPGVVKAAYSSGKPALGVGAGNTPVYLEKSADLDMAVVDIITSKTFDNGTICASEQTVVIDDEIYDMVLEKFAELGAHICNEKETELLGRTVIDPEDRLHAAHGRWTESHRYRPLRRHQGEAAYQAADRAHSRRGPRDIRCRWRSCFRCSRSIARNPWMRR